VKNGAQLNPLLTKLTLDMVNIDPSVLGVLVLYWLILCLNISN